MKGHSIPYTAVELAWLAARRTMVITDLHLAFCAEFARDDVSAGNLHALRKRKGWKTGRTGCFAKGQEPPNKGKTMAYNANSAATRFKKGERRGVAVRLYKPVGTERLSKDGYIERKIHDGLPLQSRWRAVHLVNWEAVNGPIPKGHALKCLDGDKSNTSAANWELVPRALLPRLAGGRNKTKLAYDDAPPELKPTILAIAKLEHGARLLRKAAS